MADSADSQDVHWYCPENRGQLSITEMHIPRRLRKTVRQMKISGEPYEIRINHDFRAVINACAQETNTRSETWINDKIIDAYCQLHIKGYAHSVECWQEGGLVGGLYGISIGAAFFGESMFSVSRDTSKVCLVHLVARLNTMGYKVLDTQFTNDHLQQFGVYEIPHQEYITQLEPILSMPCVFDSKVEDERDMVRAYLTGNKG